MSNIPTTVTRLHTTKAVVLLSGGQDSTTCLGWAIDKFGQRNVMTCMIDYGQRHAVELDCAETVAEALGVSAPKRLHMPFLRDLGSAALTNPDIEPNPDATHTGNEFAQRHELPSTFVPGRNALFITAALAYGAPAGAIDVVTGVCEADEAGYPDCRGEFVYALETALRRGFDERDLTIHAPLLKRSKAATFRLADDLNILEVIIENTHTCYHGDRKHRHAWGYGCGGCGACVEREKGWIEFTRDTSNVAR